MVEIGANLVVCELGRPTLRQLWPKLGQRWPMQGKVWLKLRRRHPMPVEPDPTSAEPGNKWADVGPNLVDFEPTSTEIGPNSAKLAPSLAGSGPHLAARRLDIRSKLLDSGLDVVGVARIASRVGRNRHFVRTRANWPKEAEVGQGLGNIARCSAEFSRTWSNWAQTWPNVVVLKLVKFRQLWPDIDRVRALLDQCRPKSARSRRDAGHFDRRWFDLGRDSRKAHWVCRSYGGRRWPARSSISPTGARKRALRVRIWPSFRSSGAEFGHFEVPPLSGGPRGHLEHRLRCQNLGGNSGISPKSEP